jgi:hypothetical protein
MVFDPLASIDLLGHRRRSGFLLFAVHDANEGYCAIPGVDLNAGAGDPGFLGEPRLHLSKEVRI